jgi:hypothetical protein
MLYKLSLLETPIQYDHVEGSYIYGNSWVKKILATVFPMMDLDKVVLVISLFFYYVIQKSINGLLDGGISFVGEGAGGLLDFDATLPLVAIHFILLMIILKFCLYGPSDSIRLKRRDQLSSFVDNGVYRAEKIIGVFYKRRIRDFLQNAVFTRNFLIYCVMELSYERNLLAQNRERMLQEWVVPGLVRIRMELQTKHHEVETRTNIPSLSIFPPEFIREIFLDEAEPEA